MKTIIILFTLLTGVSINASEEGWYHLNDDFKDSFNSVFFIDDNEGWLTSTYYIYHTSDEGKNWEIQFHQRADTPPLEKIRFIDRNNGYCVFWQVIMNTRDGGKNWEWNEPAYTYPIPLTYGLHVMDSNTIWICGSGRIVNLSGDSLNVENEFFTNSIFYDIFFINHQKGWAVGRDVRNLSEVIYATIDSGNSWFKQYSTESKKNLKSVSFTDENNGWAVGTKGIILHTSDGGLNWEYQNSGVSVDLNSIKFVNSLNGWIVGYEGTILNTSDGGHNWIKQTSSTSNGLFSVFFIDSVTGWAVGKDAILKTTNGGTTFINELIENSSEYNIAPNPFTESISIQFHLLNPGYINISLCDHFGRRLFIISDKYYDIGEHSINFNGANLIPGVYYFLFKNGFDHQSKRVILIR